MIRSMKNRISRVTKQWRIVPLCKTLIKFNVSGTTLQNPCKSNDSVRFTKDDDDL